MSVLFGYETKGLRKVSGRLNTRKKVSLPIIHKEKTMNSFEEKPSSLDLERRFIYHKPTEEKATKFPIIRDKAKELAYILEDLCPNGREKSLALTKLEEVVMWANAGISRE